MSSRIMIIVIVITGFQTVFAQSEDTLQGKETIEKYLAANQFEKEQYINAVINSNNDFNVVYNLLTKGKNYSATAPKGFFVKNYINKQGIEHPNLVFIPYNYNPEIKYQVKIFLHGGVSTFNARKWVNTINRKDTAWLSVNTINIYPSSWAFSKWWNYSQYENISKLLSYIKENYNVDENNVSLSGVSNGGTGVYYLSNFYQTPFSCYLPYIGSMETLLYQNNKEIYINNYQGLNFYIVNARKDEIFDINFIVPTISALKQVAKEVKFTIVDTSTHNLRWFPILKDSIENFIDSHKRNPFPDLVKYSTEKPDTFCRKFWVKINMIGFKKGDIAEELNTTIQNERTVQLFPRKRLFGQIEVFKNGNTVYVKTKNVRKYSLLISPKHFDFNKPIEVYTNGVLSFNSIIQKKMAIMLKYYTEDNDREMLFASELEIKVGKEFNKKKELSN